MNDINGSIEQVRREPGEQIMMMYWGETVKMLNAVENSDEIKTEKCSFNFAVRSLVISVKTVGVEEWEYILLQWKKTQCLGNP